MMNKVKLGVLPLVLLAFSSAAPARALTTRCVKPAGAGGCYALIQIAVNVSTAGDRVLVGPGTYYENVTVPAGKDGLQILGASKVTTILDPGFPNAGVGLTVNSRDVEISNLQIRNGVAWGIQINESGAIVRGVNVTGADGGGILILPSAWNVQVLTSELHDTQMGVYDLGFGAIVKGNLITNVGSFAIYVAADAAQVVMNRVSTGLMGVLAIGDGVVVSSNDASYFQNNAILVSGSAPTVQRNKVFGAGAYGINVACTNCFGGSASWNAVTDSVLEGLYVTSDGPGLRVENNTLLRAGRGLTLSGIGIVAQVNRVSDAGAAAWAPCFSVFGELNSVAGNSATSCSSSGFYVNGDNNRLARNTATTTQENGFTVDGNSGGSPFDGNVLTNNQTIGDAGQGFAIINGATNTNLTGNRASLNRVDFCDQGTGTVGSGNLFGTTAATCPIVH